MKIKRKTMLYCLSLLLCALPLHAQLDTITNGASFGMWRTNWINPAILQVNTNTLDIAELETDVIAVSNAFIAADAALSNALGTAAFLDSGTNNGDLVLMESLSAWAVDTNDFATAAQGTLADSAMQPADGTVLSNGLTSAYAAADTAVSNGLTSAYAAADTAVSNAFIAADAALSNLLAGAGSITLGQATNIARYVVSQSNSLYATAAQGSTADSAMQPADGTALSNGVTSAYAEADIALSNALASAGSGSSSIPLLPAALVLAYTFDGDYLADWWGGYGLENPDVQPIPIEFNATRGYYLDFDGTADGFLATTSTVSIVTNYSVTVVFNQRSAMFGDQYFLTCFNGTNGFEFYYDDSADDLNISVDSGADMNIDCTMDSWHVATLTSAAGSFILYFDNDGQVDTLSATISNCSDYIAIGARYNDSSSPYDTRVDNVYLWSRVLTSNEVVRLHSLELSGEYGVQGLRRP